MASSINASTSGAGGVITTADSSGILNLQSGGTTVATISSTGFSTPANQTINTANTFGFKNRIINGGMTIDQRNAGAAINSAGNVYTVDRFLIQGSVTGKFNVQQNQGSITPPTGFINYLGATSNSAYSITTSDYFILRQPIEGLNCADLAWGTANAKAVTLSFYVYSSLTGTFSGHITNSASTRWYPYTYTVSSANTWTPISVTIAGDTTGTWLTTNGAGIVVGWSLGTGSSNQAAANAWTASTGIAATGSVNVVSTNGATFYITGVQFEVGSQATSFDFRDYGRELFMCYRYYQKLGNTSYGAVGTGMIGNDRLSSVAYLRLNADMRAAPTLGFASLVATDRLGYDITIASINGTITSTTTAWGSFTHAAAGTAYYPNFIAAANANGYLSLTAEL